MNKDQVTGVSERVLYGIVMYFVSIGVTKGWYDGEMAAYFAGGITAGVGALWAFWINRPKALIQSAAAQANTVIVTSPEIANSSPELNIVSNTDTKVTPK